VYWAFFSTFFNIHLFTKTVPISQFLTKSNNSNTHFGEFFTVYTNQIKIKKIFFDQTRPDLSDPKLGLEDQNSNIFISRHPGAIDFKITQHIFIFFIFTCSPSRDYIDLPTTKSQVSKTFLC
jgi:hypothetical protein